MRRALVLSAAAGVFLAGLGCKHVAGRCDCTASPADEALPVAGNPYHPVGQPVVGVPATVAPVTPAPTPERLPVVDGK